MWRGGTGQTTRKVRLHFPDHIPMLVLVCQDELERLSNIRQPVVGTETLWNEGLRGGGLAGP